MKRKIFFSLGFAALLFSGCVVQSIHPLFAEKDYIAYPSLVGTWTQSDDGKEEGVWTFVGDSKRYQLTHTDKKEHKAIFQVAAGKIGTNVFLDFFPDDLLPGSELNEFAAVHLIGAHIFAKAVKTNDALLLIAMDVEWLDKYLEQNPNGIAHVVQDKRAILTASTEDLQKFVAKHGNDEKVFKNEIKLVPKKP